MEIEKIIERFEGCAKWLASGETADDKNVDMLFCVLAELRKIENGDYVEVVRCRDCKSWDKSIQFMKSCACSYWSESKAKPRMPRDTDYCSQGERKEVE